MIDFEVMKDVNVHVPSWQYDETIPVGRDFTSQEVVEAYDAQHRRFRDVDKENAAIIAGLDLQRDQVLADFGCGTGAFALQAARCCSRVHAIDVSAAMLDYTRRKARSQGLSNIVCHQEGFLTYVHTEDPVDAVTSSLALHHLPDFWKQKALARLNAMLREGGRLFLADVVFSGDNCEAAIAAWIDKMEATAGPQVAESIRGHVRKEYSTWAWIMEGLLQRAGFQIDRAEYTDGVLARYYATKVKGI
jgi:putative AdoMet-dependent methyltransferase